MSILVKSDDVRFGRKAKACHGWHGGQWVKAHISPQASLWENRSLLRTGNVRRQISEHIFPPIRGCCWYSLFFLCVLKLHAKLRLGDFCARPVHFKSSNLNSRGETCPLGKWYIISLPQWATYYITSRNGQVCPLEFHLADEVRALCLAFRQKV